MTASSSKEENLAKAETFVRLAAERGAALIVLPEVFSWRGPRAEEPAQVEPIPGPTAERLQELARRHQVHLLAGSFLEKTAEPRSYNTSLFLSPQGEILAHYRKIHLFDVDIPGQVRVKESDTKKPGQEVVACTTPLGAFGLSVCYDLRFPELYRQLADQGAEVIFIPSAFTFPTGAAHCRQSVKKRQVRPTTEELTLVPLPCLTSLAGLAAVGKERGMDREPRASDRVRACHPYRFGKSPISSKIALGYRERSSHL